MTIPPEIARKFSSQLAALHAAGEPRRLAQVAAAAARVWSETKDVGPEVRDLLQAQLQAHVQDCRARLAGTPATGATPLLPTAELWQKFTPREREVATHLPLGRTDAQIAARLGIARATVSKHVEHILAKTGAETRTAAVAAVYGHPR